MNGAIEALLKEVEENPLPRGHVSVYWQHYGSGTVVQRKGDDVVMKPFGFEPVAPLNRSMQVAHRIERLLYWPVTARFRSYPAVWRLAVRLARDLSSDPNFNVFKAACVASVLSDHWNVSGATPRTVAVIGDGYGFLGALIRRRLPESRLYCIDLPKTLMFQARTHETADPAASMALLGTSGFSEPAQITLVLPQDVEQVPEDLDCAINVASMQEMTTTSIAAYFAFLRRRSTPHSRFYCVNRFDKELPGGERTRFYDYPWQADDEVFLDEPCPYYRHFIAPYTLRRGPRMLGLRVPYLNYFDGVHIHRLVRLTPQR